MVPSSLFDHLMHEPLLPIPLDAFCPFLPPLSRCLSETMTFFRTASNGRRISRALTSHESPKAPCRTAERVPPSNNKETRSGQRERKVCTKQAPAWSTLLLPGLCRERGVKLSKSGEENALTKLACRSLCLSRLYLTHPRER